MKLLVPAYTDYRHPDDVGEAYERGDDFLLLEPGRKTYCSKRDFPNEKVEIRFDRHLKFVVL